MSLDLQTASSGHTEMTHMPKRSHKRDRELSMMRLKSPPAKKKASKTVAPSGVVKKLKSPPAKRKPTDTGPIKIEEGEPSPALKKLLAKHMVGKVIFKKY